MNIVIVSAFRNMSARINRYFQQVHALQEHIGEEHQVRVVAVEGDSVDSTEFELVHMAELWQTPLKLIKHSHGKPHFGSTEAADRLDALTGVMKAGLAAVDPKRDDVALYVESDLLWVPHMVGSVIDLAERRQDSFDIVAPLVFAGDAFYDIWAFRGMDEERFGPFPPYHSELATDGITEVSSVGSCFAVRTDALAKVKTIVGRQALLSFCQAARKKKLRIGVAPEFRVDHP